jgi:hypothetical protein
MEFSAALHDRGKVLDFVVQRGDGGYGKMDRSRLRVLKSVILFCPQQCAESIHSRYAED